MLAERHRPAKNPVELVAGSRGQILAPEIDYERRANCETVGHSSAAIFIFQPLARADRLFSGCREYFFSFGSRFSLTPEPAPDLAPHFVFYSPIVRNRRVKDRERYSASARRVLDIIDTVGYEAFSDSRMELVNSSYSILIYDFPKIPESVSILVGIESVRYSDRRLIDDSSSIIEASSSFCRIKDGV